MTEQHQPTPIAYQALAVNVIRTMNFINSLIEHGHSQEAIIKSVQNEFQSLSMLDAIQSHANDPWLPPDFKKFYSEQQEAK